MHSRTARLRFGVYTGNMQLISTAVFIAMLWVSTVPVDGIAANVNAVLLWTVLGAVGTLSLLAMMQRKNQPRQSMSHNIQEVRR